MKKKSSLARYFKRTLFLSAVFLLIGVNSCRKDLKSNTYYSFTNPYTQLDDKQRIQSKEITDWLATQSKEITSQLQLNKSQQNVLYGKHIIRIPFADDGALFFAKENGLLKVYAYVWINEKPTEKKFTGKVIAYSLQDNQLWIIVYEKGKVIKGGQEKFINPSSIASTRLKTLDDDDSGFSLAKFFCLFGHGTWAQKEAFGPWTCIPPKIFKVILTFLTGGGEGGAEGDDGNNEGVSGLPAGIWFGQGPQTPPAGGNGGGGGGNVTAPYGGGDVWVGRWVVDDNGCTISGPMDDPNAGGGGGPVGLPGSGGENCSGPTGHWETYVIEMPKVDPNSPNYRPQPNDTYTDPATNITYRFGDISAVFENNPSLVDQIDQGDFDQISNVPLPIYAIIFSGMFQAESECLRILNPSWPLWYVYSVATYNLAQGIIHFSLDIVGLVPVVGEAADILNGAIYFIEGDNVNCALSLASAIPVTGWVAVGGKWVKAGLTSVAVTDHIIKIGYRAIKVGKEVRFVKAAMHAFDYAALHAASYIKPADATLRNISKGLVDKFGIRIVPTDATIKNLMDDIVLNGDSGDKTEVLSHLFFEKEGYVKYDSHFGSNNGFDGVYIKGNPANPTNIIINEAKPIASTGNIQLNKANPATNLPAQMTDAWIQNVINRMKEQGGNLQNLAINIENNKSVLTKTVTGVDRSTGEFVILKLISY